MTDATFACGLLSNVLVITFSWVRTYDIARLAAKANIRTSLSTLILRDGEPLLSRLRWAVAYALRLRVAL